MMVDRLLKSTPDGKLTVFKSGLFGGQNGGKSWKIRTDFYAVN